MSEMIERVARAIDGRGWDPECNAKEETKDALRKWALIKARAAIEAMKEPTEEMLNASRYTGELIVVGQEYREMIDAALSEFPTRMEMSDD